MSSVLLLSGGIDSSCVAYWKRPGLAITIDYGQCAAEAEIVASRQICSVLGVDHEVLRINCKDVGAGLMSGQERQLSVTHCAEWWPFRNQLLITFGAARALLRGADTLLIGTVNQDCRHRDGTPGFMEAMAGVLLYQEGSLKLEAPAIELSAVELVLKSRIPNDLLGWTHSCHSDVVACGLCPGCQKNEEIWSALANLGYWPAPS